MTLKEYQDIIIEATYEDWTRIVCWGAGSGPSYKNSFSVWSSRSSEFNNVQVESHATVLSLKKDLLISVAHGISHNDEFKEDWAQKFPDSSASSAYIDFFYANQLVFRDIGVAVDGGRCTLPLPDIKFDSEEKIEALTVSSPRSQFFDRVLNDTAYSYGDYLSRAGITETDDRKWMI